MLCRAMASSASSSRGVDNRPSSERITTILSIDGGGMRGLIPLAIIASLEKKLQEIEKKNGRDESDVRIADYFDVIAGTSTGGLIATMLAVPDDMSKAKSERRPKYTAEDIRDFYYKHGEEIFTPAVRRLGPLRDAVLLQHLGRWGDAIRANMAGPKYDKKKLEGIIGNLMRYESNIGGNVKNVDLTLADTLSNLVVPTFDVKRLGPVTFSSFPSQRVDDKGVKPSLTDVCMATAAAPTYFAPRKVKGFNDDGTVQQEFHLVDGGLAANNPTMVAIARIASDDAAREEKFDCNKCLVLSIGTGYAKERDTYTAEECKKWSDLDWIRKGDHYKPIIDMLFHANEYLVNLNVATLFHSYGVPENYLRIQAVSTSFPGPQKPMDAASKEDLEELYRIGNDLLKMPLARISMASWNYWYVDAYSTNQDLEPSEIAAGTHIMANPHKHLNEHCKYLRFDTSTTTSSRISPTSSATSAGSVKD